MDNNELKTATVSSLLWKLMERGGNAVIQLIVQIVMARLLAPDQFGALAIMLVFVNVGNVIVQSGLNTALVQAKDVSDRDYSTVFWMCASISRHHLSGYLFLCACQSPRSMPSLILFGPCVALASSLSLMPTTPSRLPR